MTTHKILIADDHPDIAETLATLLEFFGHEVRCAFDGEQAMRMAEVFEPDVVILDINMPLADGYQVARTLRATRNGKQFIIAMTGASHRETAQKAQDAGFNLHMTKPVSVEALESILERI
ncbi:MAG: response regulator [Rubrivivax sp.]|nr:MAG: response regulator [Rubrivivax sp.]